MDRRSYNKRFLGKVFFCILGMAVLFFIAVTYRNYIIKEGKEPYLTVKEILPVVQAFSEKQGLTIYEDAWKGREQDGESYVTVGEVRTFLSFFPQTKAAVLEEYNKDTWYMGVGDWNHILTEIVSDYGEEEIFLCNMALMGDETVVVDETGQSLGVDEVLTDLGVRRAVYWNTDTYLYSSVNAVCREEEILSIVGPADTVHGKQNVYLAGVSKEEYHFFSDGYHLRYPREEEGMALCILDGNEESEAGGIYDLSFKEGVATAEEKDTEYINGKLVQISENGFEIEGYGVYQPEEDMAVYRLYGELASKGKADLRIGYDFTDFVLEDGKIAACLMIKDEDMEYIRVLLKNTDYAGRYHEDFRAQCDQDYQVVYYENGLETKREEKSAGDTFAITFEEFDGQNERIKLLPKALSAVTKVESIGRSQGIPSYKGIFEITAGEDGLLVVNEVLLEEYLYRVVPSEMPSSYPKEALMSQAVCARTYAYGKMLNAGLPSLGAHVDDSAGFQVYNNIREQDATTEAVRATHNRIAEYQGEPIGTYYYSTSCGVGSDASVWHGSSESPAYLKAQVIAPDSIEAAEEDFGIEEGMTTAELAEEECFREWIQNTDTAHFEAEEGWYRWTYDVEELDVSHLEEVLQKRYENNPSQILMQNKAGGFESCELTSMGEILDIEITKRLSGGVADEMLITGSEAVVKVISELNIRYVLSNGVTKVLRQSGDYVNASATLPSAFLVLDLKKEDDVVTGYSITGGGFGHGVGLSQNGAKNMAESGMTCEEILGFFYPGVEIKELQFGE